jgi:hypothetical protein
MTWPASRWKERRSSDQACTSIIQPESRNGLQDWYGGAKLPWGDRNSATQQLFPRCHRNCDSIRSSAMRVVAYGPRKGFNPLL